MTLFNTIPTYFHLLCNSQITYRIFTMIGLLASCCAFFWFLSKKLDVKISFLVGILFFAFAQIQLDHDGLLAFSFSYQLNTCYVFCGLAIYCDYLKYRKKSYQIVSAVLYLLSSMAYEAFILYGILFFALDVYALLDDKKLRIKQLIKDLWIHAGLVIIYVLSYFAIKNMTGIVNGDATVGTGISIKEFIVTTFKLAVGLFPLNYRQDSIKNLLFKSFDFSMLNCARWIIIFCMIFAISRLMISAKKISVRKYIRMSFFCFIGMILPGMLVAVTNKFVDMIYKIGIKSFGVSYYSYFFIIAWIAMSVVFVFQRIPIKKIFITIVMIVFAFITEFTFINNEYYIEVLSSQNDKYNLWCGVIETDYFKNLEEGAQIYLPEYIGIHYDINTLAHYANYVCGTSITTTNDFDTLNFEKPVFYLNLDNNNKAVYLARIDKEFVSDEVFVYSNEKLDGFGIIADRLSGANESELYLNGRFRNIYSSNIVTDSLNISSNEFLINCNDIKVDTFEIYKPSKDYDNGLISFRNIYEEESWGRWAESECSIIYENRNDNLESAKIYLSLSTPGKDASEIIVSCGNYKESITTSGMSSIVLEFPINVGKNELNISSSAPDIVVEGDLRKMNIQIYNIVLVVGNNEYKVCCP